LGTFLTETTVRKVLLDLVDEDESIEAVTRGTDLLERPVFVGKTNRRGLLVRLSRSFEVKETETIPLGKLDRKLRRMALVKGTYLAPPGDLLSRTDKEKALFESAKELLELDLESGESIITLGMARDGNKDPAYFYVAFTDRHIILAKLAGKREIAETESMELGDIEAWELLVGDDPVPVDIPLLSSQEQRLVIRRGDGTERRLLITDLFGHRREDAPD
jgi:hypothetical protein